MKKFFALLSTVRRSFNPYQYHYGVAVHVVTPLGRHSFDTLFVAKHLRQHRRTKTIEIYADAQKLGIRTVKTDGLGFFWCSVPDTAQKEIQGSIERGEPVKTHINQELFAA